MRIAAQLVYLLLLSHLIISVHGIRLEKESLAALMKHSHPEKQKLETQEGKPSNKKQLLHKSDEKGRGATKASTVRKSEQDNDHMIPSFHEDYYGPRDHKPKHH